MTPAWPGRRSELALAAPDLGELLRASETTQRGFYADSTRRKYQEAWSRWVGWCSGLGIPAAPAAGDVVAVYLESLVPVYALNSIRLHLTAIARGHEERGHESPRSSTPVRRWLRGRARLDVRPPRKARPIGWIELWKMVDGLDSARTGPRDRALLLVGFATGLRESELVALDVEDLDQVDGEYLARVRVSKTDPTRLGLTAGVPRLPGHPCCPVTALEEYIRWSGITSGALFRGAWRTGRLRETRLSVTMLDRILRRAALRARVPVDGLSGHSLRRGIATAASHAGCTLQEVAGCNRHRSLTTALGYIGDRDALRGHVLRKIASV